MAEHFKEACACPVCSGYLETPVRLECGFVCCQRCLDSLQKEPLGEGLLCPHCSTVSEKEDINHVSQLDRIVSKVKELEPKLRATLHMNPRVKKFQVDVTLDVDTAHSHLVISEDLRSVRCGRSAQRQGARAESFDSALCVLGAPLLASGRSYWEVDVGTSREWDVGACADTASRQGPLLLSTERGFWTVGLRHGEVFAACTVPMTELRLLPRLRRLGILLDADLGLLSFCDVADGAHIFTFTQVSARPLRPFFAPASTLPDDPGVLRICPVGPVAQDPPGNPSHHPPSDPPCGSSCQPSLKPPSQPSRQPRLGSLRGPLHQPSSQPPGDLPRSPYRQPSQEPLPAPSPQPSLQSPRGPPGRPPRQPSSQSPHGLPLSPPVDPPHGRLVVSAVLSAVLPVSLPKNHPLSLSPNLPASLPAVLPGDLPAGLCVLPSPVHWSHSAVPCGVAPSGSR